MMILPDMFYILQGFKGSEGKTGNKGEKGEQVTQN